MPTEPRLYDLMLLLGTEVPEERRAEILASVDTAIEQGGGTVVARHDWGVRTLAYEIDHQVDAEYQLLQFSGPSELLETVGHNLRITDGVTRFRIIKVLPGTPEPPEVRREAVEAG